MQDWMCMIRMVNTKIITTDIVSHSYTVSLPSWFMLLKSNMTTTKRNEINTLTWFEMQLLSAVAYVQGGCGHTAVQA